MKLEKVKDALRLNVPIFNDAQDLRKNYKKATPCNTLRKNDLVYVSGKSLVNHTKVEGYFKFDSYDKYDNTCYVIDARGTFHLNFTLDNVSKVILEKGEIMPNIENFKKTKINKNGKL